MSCVVCCQQLREEMEIQHVLVMCQLEMWIMGESRGGHEIMKWGGDEMGRKKGGRSDDDLTEVGHQE